MYAYYQEKAGLNRGVWCYYNISAIYFSYKDRLIMLIFEITACTVSQKDNQTKY